MNKELLEKLSEITPEEKKILEGMKTIERDIYMMREGSVVNAKKLLESGKLISIRPHTRFVSFPKHTHDYVEVVYMCKGETKHVINGREIVLKEGELLFLGQSATQEIMKAEKDDIAVNFIILPQFFHSSLAMIGEEETPLHRFLVNCLGKNADGPCFLHFKVADVLPIQNLVENLIWTLLNETPNKRRINQTSMGLLFIHLLNYTDKLASDDNGEIFRIFRYIEENYRDGSLTELSEILHYDLYNLSREIKRKTGKSYTELVQEKRLSQSAFLLKNTNMSVSDVALNVGYENISYFHRKFTARFGLSPKKFRDCK
ncbi:MAG: helix-turn-helix domain-containing protein [Ruminococcaceae bacterium]|nr:helix-turn-helix domain-containing protein [Oscillospiraceae bacterium]